MASSQQPQEFEHFTRTHGYVQYDLQKFSFVQLLKKILKHQGPLEQLHKTYQNIDQLTFDNDQNSRVHRTYYDSPLYEQFVKEYHEFVRNEVLPMFKERRFAVQKEPTFRVSMPNNSAIGKTKSDLEAPESTIEEEQIGLHCDGQYQHPSGEINIFLGFTETFGSNGMYFESSPGADDFRPVDLKNGQFFHFYGNQCRHYNKSNATGQTRVSVDFRVIPMSQYDDEAQSQVSSVHSKRKFVLGGYYTLVDLDEDKPVVAENTPEFSWISECFRNSVNSLETVNSFAHTEWFGMKIEQEGSIQISLKVGIVRTIMNSKPSDGSF